MLQKEKFAVWLFDLDGTLYFGNRAAAGARELLGQLNSLGAAALLVTNNSRHSALEIQAKLASMGIQVKADDIVTATEYAGHFIKERFGEARVGVAGSEAMKQSLTGSGHVVVPLDAFQIDVVALGLDDQFSYYKLKQIVRAVEKGAKLVAANPDYSHPGAEGAKVPETGALLAAVEAATGIKAEIVGKPSPHLFRYALSARGLLPGKGVMVGDNYYTDIIGGKSAGLATIWLNKDEIERDLYPAADWRCADLTFIIECLKEAASHEI